MLKNFLGGLINSDQRPKDRPSPVQQKSPIGKSAPPPATGVTFRGPAPAGAPRAALPPRPEAPRQPAAVLIVPNTADEDDEFAELSSFSDPQKQVTGAASKFTPRRAGDVTSTPSSARELTVTHVKDSGSPERAVKRKDLEDDDELVQDFLRYDGDVLTAPGSTFETTEVQRENAAYMSDGTLLVARQNPFGPAVMALRVGLRRANKPILREFGVSAGIIKKVNDTAEKRLGGASRNRTSAAQMQAMQQAFIKIVGEASSRRCSDIHMTIGRFESEIRFRCDGVMESIRRGEVMWSHGLCAAAFNMADASDASYRPNEYQGARVSNIRTPLPENVQAVRLQFNPLPNGGRYMICRLLYESSAANEGGDVDVLGYNIEHIRLINEMRNLPYGINVICGPTGSGKSTTLQKALTALMREKKGQVNVITIEDPPEYVITGAAQLPVLNATTDEERNEKFRQAISASLRSDPDIIMIGEIRDKASSSLAFAAAMTGHQVWCSLHANDAISILDRFRDQQVEDYKLTDHTLVTGLIGQRLIRRLCDSCKVPMTEALEKTQGKDGMEGVTDATPAKIAAVLECVPERFADKVFFARKKGCDRCRAGYKGRTVIAECMMPNEVFMNFIRDRQKNKAIAYWLSELNGLTIQEHALQKMVKGMCDPGDVEEKTGPFRVFDKERSSVVFETLFN